MNCTWKDCPRKARYAERDIGRVIYARTCTRHHHELKQAIESGDQRTIFKAYVEAQGLSNRAPGIPCPDPTEGKGPPPFTIPGVDGGPAGQ